MSTNKHTAKPAATKTKKSDKQSRLAEQLRANLQKRKAQTRARRKGAEDLTEGLPAAEKD